ncbi:MAG: sensor histidine kinase [Pseudohongiellaceae bacterium]
MISYTMINYLRMQRLLIPMARKPLSLSLAACLMLLVFALPLCAQEFATQFTVIESVDYLLDGSTTPPENANDWQQISLPFGSLESRQVDETEVIWMRFTLNSAEIAGKSFDSLTENYSLYIHRHNLTAEFFFNGQRIGGDIPKPNRYISSWNHPLLIDIQNANWQEGDNEVTIRFIPSYFGGNFFPILFGKTNELSALFDSVYFQRIQINEALQLLGGLVTVLACFLWIVRRNDSTYLLLGGMAAMWTVLTTHMVVYYNVIEHRYWLPLVHIAFHLFTFLFFHLLLRLGNFQAPRAQRFLVGWLAVAAVWNQLSMLSIWWMGTYALHGVGILFVLYLLLHIGKKAIFTRDKLSIAISITVLTQLAFMLHDLLMVVAGGSNAWETGIHYTQFAFPLLIIVFTAILMNRFLSALSLAENLNVILEAKVEASREIIEQSYAQNRQLELQQVAEKERLSIYRDLHDDVGSKLLSIVHAGRDNTLGELARNALESLRNAVSRANSEAQPIVHFLRDMQEETKLRLQGSGHQVHWQQPDRLPEIIVSAEHVFNLNQIVRELISNIIRHANASVVDFNIDFGESELSFTVSDDGIGLNASCPPGNGLNNMNQRISEINGSLQWQQLQPSGTRVVAQIPL